MANIVTKIDNQLYSNGPKPLDAKLQPVNTFADLASIPLKDRYMGMTIVVLNNVYEWDEDEEEDVLVSSDPKEYWLKGGITNSFWVEKTSSTELYVPIEGEDIENV